MKSARERYNAIMNGEDTDQDTPSIDVEINIIQKEVEAGEVADEINEATQDIEKTAETVENVNDTIEEAEMLINILRTDGLNPIVLKILQSKKIYNEVWNVPFPSIESLDTYSMNRYQAEQLANSLEGFLDKAKAGASKIWNNLIEKVKIVAKKFNDKTYANNEKVEKILKEIQNTDQAAFDNIKDAEVSILTEKQIKNAISMLNQAANYKYGTVSQAILSDIKASARKLAQLVVSKINKNSDLFKDFETISEELSNVDIKKNKVKLSEIVNDLKKGKSSKYYEAANKAYEFKDIIEKNINDVEEKCKEVLNKLNNIDNSLAKKIKRMMENYTSRFSAMNTRIMNLSMTIQQSYIVAGTKLLSNTSEK